MPQIPVYRPQVRQGPIADTRLGLKTTPGAMGADVGQGIANLGQGIASATSIVDKIAAEERQKADNQQITQAAAQATGLANDLQLDYEKHKLDDAVKVRGDYEKRHNDGLDEIAKGLSSEKQREAFANWRAGHQVAFQSAVRNRAYTEGEKSYDITDQITRDELTRSIRINADPEIGPEGLAQVQNTLESLAVLNGFIAQRKGLNADQLAEMNRQDAAGAHATIVNTWNEAGYSLQAKDYFDQHKEALDPKTRDVLERALDIGTTKALAQSKSTEIYSPDKTLEEMFTQADAIPDQKVQAEVKQRLEERHSLRLRAVQEVQDRVFKDAYEKVKGDPKGFDALTPGERTAMGPQREEQLKAWTLRQAKGQPLPWQASKAVRYQIEQAAGNPATRDAFGKANLLDYVDKLNEDDFNALSKLQADVRSGKTAGADWLNSREDKVNQALASMGIDPKPYSTVNGKTIYNQPAVAFRSAVSQEAARLAADGKRDLPSDDDVQKAIDAVSMKKVRLNEWGSDPERVAATLAADDRGKAYVPIEQVPANYNSSIRDAISARSGRDATDDQVQRAYAAALIGDRALYDSILAGQ